MDLIFDDINMHCCKIIYKNQEYSFIINDTVYNIISNQNKLINIIHEYHKLNLNYRLKNVIFYNKYKKIVDVPLSVLTSFYPGIKMSQEKDQPSLGMILSVMGMSDIDYCEITKIDIPKINRYTLNVHECYFMDLFD
jgi:hypothetical protein